MAYRTMFDGVNLARVPKRGATMIAYYEDLYTAREVSALFPSWSKIPINRHGNLTDTWRVLDVETGAISPTDDLEALILDFNEHSVYFPTGGRPVIYCDRNNIADVREKTGRYILGRNYYLWIATLDGTQATAESLGLPTGSVVACQDRGYPAYDSSVVYSGQWVP